MHALKRLTDVGMTAAVAAVLALAAGGCGGKGAKDAAADPHANRPTNDAVGRDFETSQDPPMQANTHYAAGRLAESQNELGKAVEQYWAAVKLEPKHRDSLFRLGIVYAQLKHYPDAIVAWKLYLKATDGDATGYSNLGFCYELSGNMDEAETAYKKGIERDPKNNPCRVNYGLLLARQNRPNEAMLQLQSVLTPAEVHYDLASMHERLGHKEQAKSEYRKALELDPTMQDAQTRLDTMGE